MNRKVMSLLLAAVMVTTSVIPQITGSAKKSVVSAPKSVVLTIPSGKATAIGKVKVRTVNGVKIKKRSFKSSNNKIVKVSKKGVLTGLKEGSVKIKIKVSYVYKKKKAVKTLTTKVTVKKAADAQQTAVLFTPEAPTTAPNLTVSSTPSAGNGSVPATPIIDASIVPPVTASVVPSADARTETPRVSEKPEETFLPTNVPATKGPEKSDVPDVTKEPVTPTKTPFVTKEPIAAPTKEPTEVPTTVPVTKEPAETEAPTETKNPFEYDPTPAPTNKPGWDINPTATPEVTVCPDGKHVWGAYKVTKEATCTEKGERERTCDVCNGVQTADIPALDHVWKQTQKAATCTSPAINCKECTRCHSTTDESNVDGSVPLGHDYSEYEIVTEATCTQGGSRVAICSRCSQKKSDDRAYPDYEPEVVPALGHRLSQDGICERCEKHIHSFQVDENGYEISDGLELWYEDSTVYEPGTVPSDVVATCGTKGVKFRKCTYCGRLERLDINPTGEHHYGDWKTVRAACMEDGLRQRICDVCGDVDEETIPMIGHHNYEWVTVSAATCTEAGTEQYQCVNDGCMETTGETRTISALGHAYVIDPDRKMVEATCTEDGSIPRICKRCGEKSSQTIEKLGHADENGHVSGKWEGSDPTCTKAGERKFKCDLCGKYVTKEEAEENEKLRDYAPETLNALGHIGTGGTPKGDWETITAATCTKAGEEKYKCDLCGEYITGEDAEKNEKLRDYAPKTLKPQYHVIDGIVSANQSKTEPTCTTAGTTTYTCTICHRNVTAADIENAKNDYGENSDVYTEILKYAPVETKPYGHIWKNEIKLDDNKNATNLIHEKDCQHYAEYYQVCSVCHKDSRQCAEDENKDYSNATYEDTDGGKLNHSGTFHHLVSKSGGLKDAPEGSDGDYCGRICTRKLYNGETCGKEYDIHWRGADPDFGFEYVGTKDRHRKCKWCGKFSAQGHTFDQGAELSVAWDGDRSITMNGTQKAYLITLNMSEFAGKQIDLTLNFDLSANGTKAVSGAIFADSSKVGDISGNQKTSASVNISVPSTGVVKLYLMGTPDRKVTLDDIAVKNQKCVCGYSKVSTSKATRE